MTFASLLLFTNYTGGRNNRSGFGKHVQRKQKKHLEQLHFVQLCVTANVPQMATVTLIQAAYFNGPYIQAVMDSSGHTGTHFKSHWFAQCFPVMSTKKDFMVKVVNFKWPHTLLIMFLSRSTPQWKPNFSENTNRMIWNPSKKSTKLGHSKQ